VGAVRVVHAVVAVMAAAVPLEPQLVAAGLLLPGKGKPMWEPQAAVEPDYAQTYLSLLCSQRVAEPWQPWQPPRLEVPPWCDQVGEKYGNLAFTRLPQHPCAFLRNATAAAVAAGADPAVVSAAAAAAAAQTQAAGGGGGG
jgi:hypothetical protein